jgi:hypothetical protein
MSILLNSIFLVYLLFLVVKPKLKEYKIETVGDVYKNPKYAKKLEDQLNTLAKDGWELNNVASFYLIMEREKH